MNIKPVSSSSVRGSTYLVVLWIALLAGIVLMAYLSMVNTQNYATMRSQAWNRSIAVAEAGVEDALSQMHQNGLTNMDFYRDGWWFFDGNFHTIRWLGDAIYEAVIVPSQNPVVYSRGWVPLIQNFASSRSEPGPFLADMFWIDRTLNGYLARAVRVETKPDGMFAHGLVARYWINLNGNNIRTDSFDSTDPTASMNGLYYAPWARDNGDIATASGLTNTVNISVGNANIYGHAATGPQGTMTIGPNGSVGSMAWHNGGNSGLEPDWFRDDLNISFPPVPLPFSSGGFTPSPGTVDGTNYTLVLGSGNYRSTSSQSFSGHSTILVNGRAAWWCQAGISLSGQATILIAPGASLCLYVGNTTGSGVDASLAGNGVVNGTGYSTNFFCYGLPSNTTMSLGGNAALVGAIYAPNAALSLNGGGNNTFDFCGAGVFSTVTMNGHFNFHYDECLGRLPPLRGYIILSWNEI